MVSLVFVHLLGLLFALILVGLFAIAIKLQLIEIFSHQMCFQFLHGELLAACEDFHQLLVYKLMIFVAFQIACNRHLCTWSRIFQYLMWNGLPERLLRHFIGGDKLDIFFADYQLSLIDLISLVVRAKLHLGKSKSRLLYPTKIVEIFSNWFGRASDCL